MTSTDEILKLPAYGAAEVTEADLAAFAGTAARGAGSAVVRALLAARPAGAPPGDPAWTAWLTAAAAVAAAGESAAAPGDGQAAGAVRPAWFAVCAVAAALAGPRHNLEDNAAAGGTVPAAVAAGMDAAAITESGLADWGGWSSGTVAAALGASVTAGLLLGLTRPQRRAALGICATQAAGLRAAEATPAFALQVGKAAFNGVEAARLAAAGLTAPDDPLDGRRGLFALFG